MTHNTMESIKTELDQLSLIELSDEILSNADIQGIVPKIQDVVKKLNEASEVLAKASDRNAFVHWWNSTIGKNDKILLSSEQIAMESSKLTIGLALLSTMYAKLIKKQQDDLIDQQLKLREHQELLALQQGRIKELNYVNLQQNEQIIAILESQQTLRESAVTNEALSSSVQHTVSSIASTSKRTYVKAVVTAICSSVVICTVIALLLDQLH